MSDQRLNQKYLGSRWLEGQGGSHYGVKTGEPPSIPAIEENGAF